jgi:hypothetical protein
MISRPLMFFIGLPVGIGLGLGSAAIANLSVTDTEPVRIVCESFVGPAGPAGPAGADGQDGKDGSVRFTHVPELEGLFHKQNVKIEYHD